MLLLYKGKEFAREFIDLYFVKNEYLKCRDKLLKITNKIHYYKPRTEEKPISCMKEDKAK